MTDHDEDADECACDFCVADAFDETTKTPEDWGLVARLLGLVVAIVLVGLIWQHFQQQSYWYCYDTGAPSPHHLGHVISGDHLCSSAELGQVDPEPGDYLAPGR